MALKGAVRAVVGFMVAVAWLPGLVYPQSTEPSLSPLLSVLEETEDPEIQQDILKGIVDAFEGRRQVSMPEGWPKLEERLRESPNAEVRRLTRTLALTFGSPEALQSARETVQDRDAPLDRRRQALDGLLRVRDPELPSVLHRLLETPELREAALQGLAQYADPQTPEAILGVYDELSSSEKKAARHTLASRTSFARSLLTAIEEGRIASEELSANLLEQLRRLEEPEITRRAETIAEGPQDLPEDKEEQIQYYKRIARTEGEAADPINGRALFAQTCQQCHTLFGVGNEVGPDLTGSNRTDLDYIVRNTVAPNAEVGDDYRTVVIETANGSILSGILKRETEQTIALQTVTGTVTLPKDEVASRRREKTSMMPKGLLAALSDQEVRDLLAYLSQPRQVAVQAGPWTLDLFFNGEDLTNWQGNPDLWRVEDGTIIGEAPTGLDRNEFLKSQMIFADFRLVCEVRLVPNEENSGIQFRSRALEGGDVEGYQADIGQGWWGKLYEEHGRGLLWDEPAESAVREEDWNTYEIVAVDDRVRTALNGEPCVDLNDPEGAREGIIALQLHSGGPMQIEFKNFRIDLDPEPKLKTVGD